MAQKKNKDRKENLNNYKQKIKKMAESKEQELSIPNIQQVPTWGSQETIGLTGLEWENIYNLVNFHKQAVVAAESVMQRNIQEGKIVMKYYDENRQEISSEKVAEYSKQMQAYFTKKAEAEAKSKASGLVTETGEPMPSVSETTNVANNPRPEGMKAV